MGFLGEAVLFYLVWQKTAPNGSEAVGEAVTNGTLIYVDTKTIQAPFGTASPPVSEDVWSRFMPNKVK